MNRCLPYLVAAAMLCFSVEARAFGPQDLAFSVPETVKSVRWEGDTDGSMLKQVREDISSAAAAKVKTLRITLTSYGGPLLTSLEIARLVRDTSEKTGLVFEIHVEKTCESGCTFVLGSGTPGHRFISKWALFMVHPVQKDGCVQRTSNPKTTDEKYGNALLDLMRDHYVRYTKQSAEVAAAWITCGNEQVGRGELAVRLHLADATE